MYGRISFLRDTKRIGDIAEMRVMCALVKAGFRVLIPFGENQRYDAAIEYEGMFYRVQIKAGRIRNGALQFNGYSSHYHRNGMSNRRYAGEIDFFGVWCAENASAYLIPVGDIGVCGCFRVEPSRNAQHKKVRWAEPYRIPGPGTKVVGGSGVGGVSLPGLFPPS